jgi:hypothetical protein
MGVVMIRCPRTRREIPTGLEMDRARFNATPVFFARAYCTHCRSEHEWFAKEAWVSDEPLHEWERELARDLERT